LCESRRSGSGKIHSNDIVCSFFATSFAAEGVVSVDVVLMMSAGTWCPVWVDREAQFATDAEEESQRGETIFDAAARHINERV
jgi:hypothetical protein